MNKKLISLAVGAALGTAPVIGAQAADVKVYGKVQFELANVDAGESNIEVGDNQRGRFGIKASEKLGNGLTAFSKLEYDAGSTRDGQIRDTNFGDSPGVREANVGLKGNFGKFTIGTMKSAYKYSGGVKYDPFVTTILEARGKGGMTGGTFGHNAFLDNSIAYQTPNLNGLTGWITYSPDEASADANARSNDGDYSAALKYSQGPFEVFVAGVENDSGDYDSQKVGGQFKMGNHRFSGQYEMSDSGGSDTDTLFLGYVLKMGNNRLVAQYGNTDPDAGSETDYFAIGGIHFMSKKTRVFAGYRNSDPDGGTETDALSIGMRMDF